MDATERIQVASNFLLQSPPGEINDVLNDIRTIIADDELLQDGIKAALKEYNIEQFTVVDVPEANHQSIISEAARVTVQRKEEAVREEEDEGEVETEPETEPLEEERFLDPRSKISFLFDHLSLEASDPKPVEPDSQHEELRSALESASLNYLKAHFMDGVTAIFPPKEGAEHFVVQIVANKYNPTNFWSGRWRSEYTIDLDKKQVAGKVLVNVHYYEQGNVQLATKHTFSFDLPAAVASAPPSTASTKIFALLEEEEGKLQVSLNETYQEMGEKTFKGLRRALPLTRQKLDWDRVMGYKLGAELSGTKSPQPAAAS